MPPPNPIAALYDIPVKKGAEAQLAKAAEAEARGKKRTAADEGASLRPKPSWPVSSQAVQRRRGRHELKRAHGKQAAAGVSASFANFLPSFGEFAKLGQSRFVGPGCPNPTSR